MPYLKAASTINWHYDLEGEGSQTLLFIHGWGVDKRIWRQQTKFFSQFYKVLTVDLPGHGKSSWNTIGFQMMAADLKIILDQLGIFEVTAIGSSIGGILALRLYEVAPSCVKKLVFVGSMPKFAKSEDYPYGLDINQIRKLNDQLETAYPAIINVFFRSLFTIEERESRRFKWLQKFRKFESLPPREALADYLAIIEKEDLREILRGVSVPIQFINGTGDTICSTQTVDYLKQISPQARFDTFEKCGHFPFLSKPYEFNAILGEFLKT